MTATNAQKIREFHREVGKGLPTTPTQPNPELLAFRKKLIDEEYTEVSEAFKQLANNLKQESSADLANLIHELTDLLYVTYGAIQSCGVDPDAVFAEVHSANMRKLGGPVRADGKILKPANWQPANVAGVIQQLKEQTS